MESMTDRIEALFEMPVRLEGNTLDLLSDQPGIAGTQEQTAQAFSKKWSASEEAQNRETTEQMQKNWYLDLYGFSSEDDLARFLQTKRVVFDAGCGKGHKAAWFAELSPESLVLAMDISDAVDIGAERYRHLENLVFIRGDIAVTRLKNAVVDYVSCDQVIHHTQDPAKTFDELTRVLSPGGHFSCYVYRKKAVPRELVDDFFRARCIELSHDELMDLSRQLTDLGKTLSALKAVVDVPDMPALKIKGGRYDLQRFIYWNFLKCYWNENEGYDASVLTNFDWYSPSLAKRYEKQEFLDMVEKNMLAVHHFHEEEACYSGRFGKQA